jgi:antitoxin ParD1/3/4
MENGFHAPDDYLSSLISCKNSQNDRQERQQLEEMLIAGLESGKPIEVNDDWWEQKKANLIKL